MRTRRYRMEMATRHQPLPTLSGMGKQRRHVLLALGVLVALGAALPYLPALADEQSDADPPVVRVTEGFLSGERQAGTSIFRNVPFAAPPVDDLRWRAPQPPTPWTGIRDATQPGSRCLQFALGPEGFVGSEDCLHLTVQVPNRRSEPLPVMVFLHGGAFTVGASSDYDATRLATQGEVAVVSLNYRLGMFGFLDHPGLTDPAAGNYGLADQQAALRWVRQNIAAFGGDPGNVTLWGESAGAFSTCAHFASPTGRGLFHKAIVQSGPCGATLLTRAQAQIRARSLAAAVDCAEAEAAACLRGVSGPALIRAGSSLGQGLNSRLTDLAWSPVVGTPLLPEQPLAAIRSGAADGIPLLHGGTRDEMRGFVANRYDGAGKPLTAAQYPEALRDIYGSRTAGAVLARYPLHRYPSPGLALATALTDDGSFLGACRQLTANASVGTPTVYAYEFAQPDGKTIGAFPLGAYHGSDVRYLLDSLRTDPWAPPPLAPEEQPLGERMVGYWTTFAHAGQPASDWPGYANGRALSLTRDGVRLVDLDREHQCDFWRERTPLPSD